MNTARRIAILTGAAAAATLGTIGLAAPADAASPTVVIAPDSVADPGATVRTADGRTVTVAGFPSTRYEADAEQRTAVVQLAAASSGMDGNTPGAPDMVPQQQAPAYPQQQTPVTGPDGQPVQTQASGGSVAVGVVAIAILGIVVFFRVKGNYLKVGDAVVVVLLGVALSGTVVGALGDQLTDSAIGSLGNLLGGL